ncbi:MAG: hypothetical protein ACJ8FY_02370 [Gemmataceae bacterium]
MSARNSVVATLVIAFLFPFAVQAETKPVYIKKANRVDTLVASLKAAGLPTFEGKWHYIGPFDNAFNIGFDAVYPPEKQIDLQKKYDGKTGKIEWKEFTKFRVGVINNLSLFENSEYVSVYLYHEIDAPESIALPISLGSDDTLKVWLNGDLLVAEDLHRPAAPDQNHAVLKLKKGKNQLLVKVGNQDGAFAFYIRPEFPPSWPEKIRRQLDKDFPLAVKPGNEPIVKTEAKYYRMATLPTPPEAVLEVGGLAFRPDGKLLACTRRGDIWLIGNPQAEDADKITYKRFATGLHEPLGLLVDGKSVYVVQRPELTKLVDKDGDDVADDYVTVCDAFGVSGDYHEFAFGPARDKEGNFFLTLNVGFGGGHQSRAPWRGWCVKITRKGELIPYATGLRSPNGINFSPEGDLFYVDNQGEWVATCKMHHVKPGEYYGHPAGLRWIKQSPFADKIPEKHASGMMYDGQKGKNGLSGMPPLTPPCIRFPYGRMGQSASEPIWDTTGGKFGQFAGQCFVGDQARSIVMRVALEKINGLYQGACFPFRSGFQCGVNRLVFGPDGSLYVGETNRGWGSLGGKPYGLERLIFTGETPFEIYAMKLTREGFDLTFTKALDTAAAQKATGYSLSSFTHYYHADYGSPEVDRRADKIESVKVSADGKKVTLAVAGLKKGRIYELHADGLKASDGDALLHPEAYYTLNELP